jgi:hypothetical protein
MFDTCLMPASMRQLLYTGPVAAAQQATGCCACPCRLANPCFHAMFMPCSCTCSHTFCYLGLGVNAWACVDVQVMYTFLSHTCTHGCGMPPQSTYVFLHVAACLLSSHLTGSCLLSAGLPQHHLAVAQLLVMSCHTVGFSLPGTRVLLNIVFVWR